MRASYCVKKAQQKRFRKEFEFVQQSFGGNLKNLFKIFCENVFWISSIKFCFSNSLKKLSIPPRQDGTTKEFVQLLRCQTPPTPASLLCWMTTPTLILTPPSSLSLVSCSAFFCAGAQKCVCERVCVCVAFMCECMCACVSVYTCERDTHMYMMCILCLVCAQV